MFVSRKIKPGRWLVLLMLHFISVQLTFSIYSGNSTTHEASGGFIVQIRWYQNFQGAGSLIHEQFVLTAAHVANRTKPEGYFIIYCETYKQDSEPLVDFGKTANRIAVINIELHPNFDPIQTENDIAVLLLARPLRKPTIKPIPLATRSYNGHELASAIGWGETGTVINTWLALQQVYVPVLEWNSCRNKMLPQHGELHPGMLCTFSGDRRGICSGDSGGPLTVNGQLIGVIIWFALPACGNGVMPDIHSDVYYYRDFIAKAMQQLTAQNRFDLANKYAT